MAAVQFHSSKFGGPGRLSFHNSRVADAVPKLTWQPLSPKSATRRKSGGKKMQSKWFLTPRVWDRSHISTLSLSPIIIIKHITKRNMSTLHKNWHLRSGAFPVSYCTILQGTKHENALNLTQSQSKSKPSSEILFTKQSLTYFITSPDTSHWVTSCSFNNLLTLTNMLHCY